MLCLAWFLGSCLRGPNTKGELGRPVFGDEGVKRSANFRLSRDDRRFWIHNSTIFRVCALYTFNLDSDFSEYKTHGMALP